ncbi:MAG: hypothetical protein ACRDSJ_00125 [Rubrobacteraceae bacterium]
MRPRDLKQWVCWRSEERGGRKTKIPCSPRSGSRARCDDPATWGTFAEAREAVRERSCDGVGFVFTADDPFCGVDLDGCVDPASGKVEPWAKEIVDHLDSYTEVSPSGTGLHIIVHAKIPEGRPGNRKDNVEIYDRLRSLFLGLLVRHPLSLRLCLQSTSSDHRRSHPQLLST